MNVMLIILMSRKKAPIEEIIIIDSEENNSHPTLNLAQISGDKVSCQEPEINRTKRKRHLDSIVEILDDDVIVLDEFNSGLRTNTEDNSLASNKENVNTTRVALDGDNKKVHHASTTKAMCEGINRLDVTTSTPIEIDDDEVPTSSRLLMSQSYVPPKKVSKLTYKRTAHLVETLTNGTMGNSVKTAADSNIYNPNANSGEKRTGLRPIVIDGNNVAISHGEFSLKRLQMCINYFEKRGHRQIKAFLPHHRINRETYSGLNLMERQGTVVFTPSRKVNGKRVASYDDRFIVQYATESGGVIVTTDNYRDLLQENPNWKETIEQRILMFSWVDDVLMFPQDPMGRHGPPLDEFLKFPD
ncbi:probable ribonuclease ZC3H12C [Homalodisca vitripennis]|uniref:probable ribonuclease ZC3H12C n=1 Tax=Homalodisca vitripennis TaxID=197043 RepID=UPI001EEA3C92|nr:probable ribonuclease ZC3H12C [Homalodisca vitripennis]XP_046660431.1 probable ribonuclease ZC3H12C [Homalodisca vitripennis]